MMMDPSQMQKMMMEQMNKTGIMMGPIMMGNQTMVGMTPCMMGG